MGNLLATVNYLRIQHENYKHGVNPPAGSETFRGLLK
jgi:hypothetical protein